MRASVRAGVCASVSVRARARSGHGYCYPLLDAGDTGLNEPLLGRGPECACVYPYWDIDCSRAQAAPP